MYGPRTPEIADRQGHVPAEAWRGVQCKATHELDAIVPVAKILGVAIESVIRLGEYRQTSMSHSGIRASPSTDRARSERRWAIVRLTLGVLQMTGAALALGLLAAGGVTRAALTVVVLTGLMTTISVVLFGRRSPRPDTSHRRSRST